jgi:hypothetical protein
MERVIVTARFSEIVIREEKFHGQVEPVRG